MILKNLARNLDDDMNVITIETVKHYGESKFKKNQLVPDRVLPPIDYFTFPL